MPQGLCRRVDLSEICLSLLTHVIDLRHRGSGFGVQRRQVVSHHAGAVLRPHLQALRLPEGQPVAPRSPTQGENRHLGNDDKQPNSFSLFSCKSPRITFYLKLFKDFGRCEPLVPINQE